jgi:hypothetical protein
MARTTTNPYNPVSTSETADNDGLSVRAARDHGWNANNYKFHAGNHKIISELWLPPVGTLDTVSADLILYLGRWYIPPAFTTVRWWLNGRLTAGTDRVDYTLYSSQNLYVGPEEGFDSTLLWSGVSDTIQITSSVKARKDSTLALGRADFNGYRYFYLVAENDAGETDATTRGEIVSLDVQPLKT